MIDIFLFSPFLFVRMSGEPAYAARNFSSVLIWVVGIWSPAIFVVSFADFWRAMLWGQTSWQMSQPKMRLVLWIWIAISGGISLRFSMV